MHKTAFVFSGQGSQYEGMGKSLLEKYSFSERYFERASDILHIDAKYLCCDATIQELSETKVSQPAILLISYLNYLAYCEEYEEKPVFYAGHSLGEYTALLSAGVIDFDECMRLIGKRADIMQQAAEFTDGTMLVVISSNEINKIITHVRQSRIQGKEVYIGCFNSSSQIVLSGNSYEISQLAKKIEETKLGRIIKLKVNGAFHSGLMSEARKRFAKVIEKATFNQLPRDSYIISNVSGEPYRSEEELQKELIDQLTQPVHWLKSVRYMKDAGVDSIIEFGAKATLTSLIRQEVVCDVRQYRA